MIRCDLLAIDDKIPSPPSPKDLCEENIIVPACLCNLLAWIIVGDSEGAIHVDNKKVTVKSVNDHCCILLIVQDMLYCRRKGHVKTPKHVLLPMTVYHHTRSKLQSTILNGFGYGISASQLSELETAMAEYVAQERERGGWDSTAIKCGHYSQCSFLLQQV